MKSYVFILLCIAVVGCAPTEKWSTEGNVSYQRSGEVCTEVKNHWLLDLKAIDSKDSVYLNTAKLGRKLEIHRLQLDSVSTVCKLLSETCEGDSLMMKLTAAEFYAGLGGKVPMHLADGDIIQVHMDMVDKLTDMEHIIYKKTYESDAVRRYLEQQRWNGERDAATGITYELLKKNPKGKQVAKKAKVSYVIKSLNEQLVARSIDGDPLIYNMDDKGILKGIHFLVSKLKEGESLRAVVPSDQAYGADGNSKVPGYMPILMDIEVIEVLE